MLHQSDTNNLATPSPSVQIFPAGAASGGGGGSAPAGSILMFGGTTAPTGWLLCNGSAVSRTTYATLFTAIGTNYGVGDGSSTFNLPDLQGRMPVGKGTHTDVVNLGQSDNTNVANRRPKHAHTVLDPGHSHGIDQWVTTSGGSNGWQTGSGNAHDNVIPRAPTGISVGTGPMVDTGAYLVVNFIIKS